MKLNNLASAVSISLAALALTACGSDDNTSSGSAPIVQDDAAKKAAEEAAKKKAAEEAAKKAEKENIDKLVKAALEAGLSANQADALAKANKTLKADSEEFKKLLADAVKRNKENSPISGVVTVANPYIDNFDSSKVPSVSTAHYIRQENSNHDRPANADKSASSGNSSFFDAAEQNPWLSNYAFGVETLGKKGTKVIAVDATGEVVAFDSTTKKWGIIKDSKDSPYTATDGLEYTSTDLEGNDQNLKYSHSGSGDAKVVTLQEENDKNTLIADATTNLPKVKLVANNDTTLPAEQEKFGLLVYNSNSTKETNPLGQQYLVPALGQEENVYGFNKDKDDLISLNKTEVATLTAQLGGHTADTANNFTTRIFGKNYRALESGPTGKQKSANTYVALYDLETGKTDRNLKSVKPEVLQYVQYGRLTNNIDALQNTEKNKKRDRSFIYRQFEEHGSPTTVDTYFYRGTHQTSIEEMKAVQAKGGTLQYFGHALTYNLGPYVPTGETKHVPTAFSTLQKQSTIGNFAQARYDIAKNQVKGSVYNLINKDITDAKSPYQVQDLATFEGAVSGNTVIGSSKKVGTEEVGSFTGSFYGKEATEFGGNIASITRKEGYAEPKWGAVFGTKLVGAEETIGNWSVGQQK